MTTFEVCDIFAFAQGATVIVGEFKGDVPPDFKAVEATVLLRGIKVGSIHLVGQRMPGPATPPRQRSLETRGDFTWDRERVRAGDYSLRWRSGGVRAR